MRASEIRAQLAALLHRHNPNHLVHVGAHEGEEMAGYVGIHRVTLIEPLPELARRLRARYAHDPRVSVVECACSDESGEATLRVPRRTNMAGFNADGDPVTVQVRRLDEIAPTADAAVIDVQGHEVQVLSAAPWDSLRLVVVETCTVPDPQIASPHEEVEALMTSHGFHETQRWVRSYQQIKRWAEGSIPDAEGEVRDVAYVRD